LRLTGVVALALAFLASASGLCLCCPAPGVEPLGHACCARGDAALRAADRCCPAMRDPSVVAAADREVTAPAFGSAVVLSAQPGPEASRSTPTHLDLTPGLIHSPPSAVLRI
jgi:hypothetical protein